MSIFSEFECSLSDVHFINHAHSVQCSITDFSDLVTRARDQLTIITTAYYYSFDASRRLHCTHTHTLAHTAIHNGRALKSFPNIVFSVLFFSLVNTLCDRARRRCKKKKLKFLKKKKGKIVFFYFTYSVCYLYSLSRDTGLACARTSSVSSIEKTSFVSFAARRHVVLHRL